MEMQPYIKAINKLVYADVYKNTKAEHTFEENRLRIEPKLNFLIELYTRYYYYAKHNGSLTDYTHSIIQFVKDNTLEIDPYYTNTVFDQCVTIYNVDQLSEIEYAIDCANHDLFRFFERTLEYYGKPRILLHFVDNIQYQIELVLINENKNITYEILLFVNTDLDTIVKFLCQDLCWKINHEMRKFVQNQN